MLKTQLLQLEHQQVFFRKTDPSQHQYTTKVPMSVKKCKIIDLPRIQDPRGNLTFIEGQHHIPFDIRRVYYLYDVPGGAERGGHGHKKLQQLIIATSGSFDIHIDDGTEKNVIHMNRSHFGLYICPMIWRELTNFSSGAVCMVLASEYYDEEDYYRSYSNFITDTKKLKQNES